MDKLINFITLHGIECKVVNGDLLALELFSADGKNCSEWIKLNPTLKDVKIWLGY
jgi:hypothetical protein